MDYHMCPYACSRCDITCPCTCRGVMLQEFDDGGALTFREVRCAFDPVLGVSGTPPAEMA